MNLSKFLNSIYINYLINFVSLNTLVILLYFFGYKQLVLDIALFGSFVILLCQIFSLHSRTLLLSKTKTIDTIATLIQRLFFSLVIFTISILFISFFVQEDRNLALCVMVALIVNWIYEIILTKEEVVSNRVQKIHLFLSLICFLLIITSFIIGNFVLLKITIILYSIVIFYQIVKFLFNNINQIKEQKYSIDAFLGIYFFSSFGSSLSISISNFLFRYFVVILSSLEISSAVIIGFMFGSLPVSLFYNIFGASLIRNQINIDKIKKYSSYFLICVLISVILILSNYNLDIILNFFNKDNILFITIFFSVLGMFPMLSGLYKRQKSIQDSKSKLSFFYLDMIFGLSVSIIVPLIYIINHELFFSTCFLLSGIFSFIIFNIGTNFKNKNLILLLVSLIPLPIFFEFFDNLREFNFLILNQDNKYLILENFYSLPIPLSLAIIPILVLSLMQVNKSKLISIYSISVSFLIGILSVIYLQRLTFSNFLNIIQFFLPMIAIIAGEITGRFKLISKIFFKNFFYLSFLIVSLQVLLVLILQNQVITPNLFGFYIYQNIEFTSSVFFLGIFLHITLNSNILVNLNDLKKINIYKLYLSILLLLFAYFTNSISIYLLLFTFSVYLCFVNKNYLFFLLIILFYFTLIIYLKDDLSLNTLSDHFKTIFVSNLNFLTEISQSTRHLFFGSNISNQLYLNEKGTFNYYLDYIYNFGLISLIPLLFLIYYTIETTYKLRKKVFKNFSNHILFFLFIFILFIDSFLRTGLKQPFIGIIYYFIWGIYLSKIRSAGKLVLQKRQY